MSTGADTMHSMESQTVEPMTDQRLGTGVRQLMSWYWPYTKGLGGLTTAVILGSAFVLGAQAVIPWLVESLLHHAEEGHSDLKMVFALLATAAAMLVVGYFTHVNAVKLTDLSSLRLRESIFGRLLTGRAIRQKGLQRAALVSRFTTDTDQVGEAFESTMVSGFPGLGQLIISLVLLSVIEWRAGIAMTIASIVFLLLRRRIGRRLLAADHARLLAASELGDMVDETITASATTTGLRLGPWQVTRFGHRAHRLEVLTHRQGVQVSRLLVAAHSAAIAGLVFVTLFALILGGENLAAVAAALLYVENAVRALEALPPWIRSVQIANVSQRRIDEVLLDEDRVTPVVGQTAASMQGLSLQAVTTRLQSGIDLNEVTVVIPQGPVIGMVTPPGSEADAVLMLMAGDENPESGWVSVNGLDVRSVDAEAHLFYVPMDAAHIRATPMEMFRALSPDTTEQDGTAALEAVGLGHLNQLPEGLHSMLGPNGIELTLNERQRLLLAVAMNGGPSVLMAGSLLAFADVDTALPLVHSLRGNPDRTTIISLHDPEVAEVVDLVMFVHDGRIDIDTHQRLLVSNPGYARIWEARLNTTDVDLSVIGIDAGDEERLMARLVTEHYAPGDMIYREGSPSDRIVFIISGHVEITASDARDKQRRVAVLGPGNHCGDLRLTSGEKRAESAIALSDCVIRTLSREAIQAGVTGLLDRSANERRIIESLLRHGPATAEELSTRLGMDPETVAAGLALLKSDGALQERDGVLSAVLKRAGKSGAADLLDRLTGL